MNSRTLYRRLLGYTRPYWRVFALALLSMALLAATEPLLPALLKPLLDGAFFEPDNNTAWAIPLCIVLLFVIRGVLSYCGQVSLAWVAQRVVMDLRAEMFRRLLVLPSAFYHRSSPGELLSKIGYDVAQVAQASTQALTDIVKDGIAILGLIAYMVWVDWRLAATVLLVAPPIVLSVFRVSTRLRSRSRQVQESMARITHVAEEAVAGHEVIKVFGADGYEKERFGVAVDAARRSQMRVVMTSAANVPVIQILLSIGVATMVYVAATLAATKSLTVGEFVSFFTAMTMLLAPVKRSTGINHDIQRGLAAAESVFRLIDEVPEHDAGRTRLGRARGEIEFRAVTFAYHAELPHVLRNVSFRVEAGQTVALVGPSGGGKSTLASLVPAFHAPSSGTVLIDGHDLRDLTLGSIRDNIAVVNQNVILFDDSIRNNIAYGALRNASDSEVVEAARAAHLLDFVRELPQGFATLVGDNGVRLSGGQRQRIAIARAILKNAPILILDEATSALDTASERHIQAALETLRAGRTCLVIAHRLSTVENADRIVVLDRGEVVEAGTHRELIRVGGPYARLCRSQFPDNAQVAAAGVG